jgi:hypothetical protein
MTNLRDSNTSISSEESNISYEDLRTSEDLNTSSEDSNTSSEDSNTSSEDSNTSSEDSNTSSENLRTSKDLNLKINKLIQINSHESMILNNIDNFYNNIVNIYDFLDIINSKSLISIRLIDHFVTKYSKKNKICYKMCNSTDNSLFYVFQSYRQQLKRYQKKHFDPFARGIRIPYFIQDTVIITTIGQLNFFNWFISKNILEYVIKNKFLIENDMNKNKNIQIDVKQKKPVKEYKKVDIKMTSHYISNNLIKPVLKNKNQILVTF